MTSLLFLFVLIAVFFPISESQVDIKPQITAHGFNSSDLQLAVDDMRSKSYFGFAILLQMLNGSSLQNHSSLTFLVPCDSHLSESPISVSQLEDFVISHAIAMPLSFNDILHFPTGSLIPAAVENKMIKVNNRGRAGFAFNNAHIVAPNVCNNSFIRCHGIDEVIQFDNILST